MPENPLTTLIAETVARRDEANIPIPKYTLAVLIHANSLEDVRREVAQLETDLVVDYAGRDHIDSNSGRLSFRLDMTNPSQTQERYDEQLLGWSDARRGHASSDAGGAS